MVPARRRRLARTFSLARWDEYDRLLGRALAEGWVPMALEEWLDRGGPNGRILILRHDVDQHPKTVLPLAQIEKRHGIVSTWYLRWRTARFALVKELRGAGHQVGLHYETLTRIARERRMPAHVIDHRVVTEARSILRAEISAFKDAFGPIRSVCPHGDSRVPGISNQILLLGEEWQDYGIAYDGNAAMRRHPIGLWLTDRAAPERWRGGTDPIRVLLTERQAVLCVVHPNNWCSGLSLWTDRMLAVLIPASYRWPLRTGDDHPPLSLPSQPGLSSIDER